MNNLERYDNLINLINILSFAIGIQNLDLNDKQVSALEEHLQKQDEQYEKIIKLLEEHSILMKGEQ